MTATDAEHLAWSVTRDAAAIAEHSAEMAASYRDVEAARDMLTKALDRMARAAGAPINEMFSDHAGSSGR